MNPLTREAVEWLIGQAEFYISKTTHSCAVHIAHEHVFRDRNTEDAICAAYEALHIKPALADERTTLPDYGNEGVLPEHTD